jgi:hypothetical protein
VKLTYSKVVRVTAITKPWITTTVSVASSIQHLQFEQHVRQSETRSALALAGALPRLVALPGPQRHPTILADCD